MHVKMHEGSLLGDRQSNRLFDLFRFMVEMSPSTLSAGADGMWQPEKTDSVSMISFLSV